ncbi:kinase domain protein (macronuclear) [Tetrahymena thermophila SB210]|uniref:Kinase domain protein n=1 Tax=Tetrahymena thermophila (strain SB210) TaxID=312017 RepID=Q230V1_TETTS|nr:kinase domain protein [Tetrahymena thermophila SB210]EAR91188.2 kinase domain protein [Tetrahymena thermophila SB210]|eukprot:XP_001011433.2 kinase domain protein [Tetrahymena thermophila SB210]
MIDEVKYQQERQRDGIDILKYVDSWNFIKFSNNSIFEVEISDVSPFIQNDQDKQFFNELNERSLQMNLSLSSPNSNQQEKQNSQSKKLILKELFGQDIKQEIEFVKTIRQLNYRIPGLIYMINYAIYQTESLEVGYILMEKGEMNLQQFLDERLKQNLPIQFKELVSIMRQSISALANLQEEKIAHNDIKLANILVFRKPIAQLAQQQTNKNNEQMKQNKKQPLLPNQLQFDQSATFSPNKSARLSSQKNNKIAPNKFLFNEYDKNQCSMQEEKEANQNQTNQQDSQCIDYEIEIKFCDIGSSQANQSTFKKTKKPGTDSYLAPEEFLGDKIHIYKYDVYSLGLCFINLIIQKTSNFHVYMKNSNWNNLMSKKDWLEILQDILEEWIRIASLRMNNQDVKTILTKMLIIDINSRPDFIELRNIFDDLFKNQISKEQMSPNSSSSPNNIEDICIENQFEISKNDSKEDKKRSQQELKNQRNFEKLAFQQRKLKINDGKAKMIQLIQNGICDNDSPSQVTHPKQQLSGFNMNSSQEEQIIKNNQIPALNYLQSNESQLIASISPKELQNKESEESPSTFQDSINENPKQQIVPTSISRKQLTNFKIHQQSTKRIPVKITDSNSIASSSSVSSLPTNITSISSTNLYNSEQVQQRKKSNTINDKKKNLNNQATNQNNLVNFAESILISSDQIKQQQQQFRQPSSDSNNFNISKQSTLNGINNQQSSAFFQNLHQNQQVYQQFSQQQSLYFQQLQIDSSDKKSTNIITADQKLNFSQSTRNQPQTGTKKIDFTTNLSVRNQLISMSSKVSRKSQQDDLENINHNNTNKNPQISSQKSQLDIQNPASFSNIPNTNFNTNQINSLTNMQFKNPFNQTINGKTSKSFKELQSINQIDSPTQNIKKSVDRRQKNVSSSQFKLPPIQNQQNEQDQSLVSNQEKNDFEGIQKREQVRFNSIQENFSIKQVFDSDYSNPASPHKYSKSYTNKGDLTPQLKQMQITSSQKSKFSNQKLIKPNLSSTKLYPLPAQNNGNLTSINTSTMHLKVSFPSQTTQKQHQQPQQMNILQNGISNNNQNNFLSVNNNLNSNFQIKVSQKSLTDQVNENFEQVTITEYSEMLKFYDNFIKVSDSNKIYKYLTLILSGTDKSNIHGIIDCLYKMDGLVHLNLQIIQQKSEVIDWALDVIETIGSSLINLCILFKDCDYKDHLKSLQSDFLKPEQLTKVSEDPFQLIVRLEGKQSDPLGILDSLISKSSSFQDRIAIFNIDIQKKNLDNPAKLVNCLKQIQKFKNIHSFGLDISNNNIPQIDSNNIFLAIEQLKNIHTLSFNISQNQPSLFDDTSLLNLPHSLQILYLNLSYNKISTIQLVKLQKSIESCKSLNTIYLFLTGCVNKDDTNLLMLFFPFLFKQVKKVGIFLDSNQLFDQEFKLYESELLNQFKVEVLTLSLNKNILSFETFKILCKMIKMQQKLKQVTITFPRTIRKQQILDQFTNLENEKYILQLKNEEFDYITIQIDIIKRAVARKQSNLSIQTGKNASLTFIPLETISNNQCWNTSKQSVIFQGFYCLTCYEKNQVKNDSYYCLYCIKNCHKDHKYIEMHDFPSVQIVCSCNDKGQFCESLKHLQSINNNFQNSIQNSPSKYPQK